MLKKKNPHLGYLSNCVKGETNPRHIKCLQFPFDAETTSWNLAQFLILEIIAPN